MPSSSLPISLAAQKVSPEAISGVRVAVLLSATAFLALLACYFVGLDAGVTSVFGRTMMVHEFMHDARHLLGFPCH